MSVKPDNLDSWGESKFRETVDVRENLVLGSFWKSCLGSA